MSSHVDLASRVREPTDADVIAALIPDYPSVVVDLASAPTVTPAPSVALAPAPVAAPSVAPSTAPTVVYVPAPVPEHSPFLEKERFWNVDGFWLAVIGLKYGAILGIVAILGFSVVYPIISFLTMVTSSIGSLGASLGAVAVVLALAFWATSLLGFWDHAKPVRSAQLETEPAAPSSKVRLPLTTRTVKTVKVPKAGPWILTEVESKPVVAVPKVAHEVSGGRATCGARLPSSLRTANRHDAKCPDCVDLSVQECYVHPDGTIEYF